MEWEPLYAGFLWFVKTIYWFYQHHGHCLIILEKGLPSSSPAILTLCIANSPWCRTVPQLKTGISLAGSRWFCCLHQTLVPSSSLCQWRYHSWRRCWTWCCCQELRVAVSGVDMIESSIPHLVSTMIPPRAPLCTQKHYHSQMICISHCSIHIRFARLLCDLQLECRITFSLSNTTTFCQYKPDQTYAWI